ncbi:MAG: aminotransferase class V-fold PLP-dependent enzyme [Dehalococcoidia bacterium]
MDIERLRAETPGCVNVIHLNNAGAGLMPRPVLDAVTGHLQREAEIGGYEARIEAATRLEAVYDSLASLLNAHRDEIAIVDNATRAFDLAFQALPLRDGDVILTTSVDYPSNYLAYLCRRREVEIEIRVVPEATTGEVSLDALAEMLREPRVRALSLTHVPTQSGLLQPAEAAGRLARAAGCWFLLDATQTAGQLPIDVQALGCDVLAATGRKFLRGPRATGFLYVRQDRLPEMLPAVVDVHSATWTGPDSYEIVPTARRFEIWEQYFAGNLGLGAATDYALAIGIDQIWQRVRPIAAKLRERLSTIPGLTLHDRGAEQCAIVSFTLDGHDPPDIRDCLAAHNPRINVSTSSINSARLDFPRRGLTQTVRASVHYYNTEAELDAFVDAVAGLSFEYPSPGPSPR